MAKADEIYLVMAESKDGFRVCLGAWRKAWQAEDQAKECMESSQRPGFPEWKAGPDRGYWHRAEPESNPLGSTYWVGMAVVPTTLRG